MVEEPAVAIDRVPLAFLSFFFPFFPKAAASELAFVKAAATESKLLVGGISFSSLGDDAESEASSESCRAGILFGVGRGVWLDPPPAPDEK